MDQKKIKKLKEWVETGSINVFGLPLSGKDTQVHRLADILGSEIIAGGKILRSHHDQDMVKKFMSTGELFPQDLYLSIITPYLSQDELRRKSLVLSSIGRWHGEEEVVMEATQRANHPIKATVYLNVNEDIVRQRLTEASNRGDRGFRHDDDPHLLDVRIEEFRSKTLPVIDFYRDKGLLVEVDGSQSPENVTDQILTGLAKLAGI